MNSLVSIIVPAFNVENYIDKCIKSILQQSYKNIEVIIVDDGSIDNTYTLAKKWQVEDARVIVVNQSNQGSGPARNAGLKIAKGQYVVFVDPDDWIDESLIHNLTKAIEELDVDLVISGCVNEYYKNGVLIETKNKVFEEFLTRDKHTIHSMYLKLFNEDAFLAPTRIIYKKTIIDLKAVSFPDLRRSQDIVFNYRYYQEIESFAIASFCNYHYRFDMDKISLKIRSDYYKSISFIFTDVKKMCIEWGIDINCNDFFDFCNHFYFALLVAMATAKSTKKIKEIAFDKGIRDYISFIQSKTTSRKARLLHKLILSKRVMLIRGYLAVWRFMKLNKSNGFN